jgi:hypothetical protein
MKVKNITVNMKKTDQGIKYFENRRDHYLHKSKQQGLPDQLIQYFRRKAEDMQDCINRVVLRKTRALMIFN